MNRSRLRADLLDRGALAGRRGELLQHDALIEAVRALRQPVRASSRSPNASSSETSCSGEAVREAFAAVLEQLGDLLAAEPELARAGLDLFAPGVGVDPVLLAIAGRERRRLPPAFVSRLIPPSSAARSIS